MGRGERMTKLAVDLCGKNHMEVDVNHLALFWDVL